MKSKKNIAKMPYKLVVLVLVLGTACVGDYVGHGPSKKETKNELRQLLDDFATTEEAKDAEAHAELYLSGDASINFVLKNQGNPAIANLNRGQWIGFFTSWDYDYFPVYSEIDFTLLPGLAANSHQFQGFRDGVEDLYGNDLFMYVNTMEGWKILSLSSTITAPDDTTDYTDMGIDAKPEAIFNAFENSFNERDNAAFTSLFINESAPCFRFKNLFLEGYRTDRHSAGVFLNSLGALPSDVKITFHQLNIEIKDQYTALASASYTLIQGNKKLEKGQLLSTMVGTPNDGWLLSALVFSIKKSSALLP